MGNTALAALALACARADEEVPAPIQAPGPGPATSRVTPARVVTEVEPSRVINRPPRFISIAPRAAREGQPYAYGMAAQDPDGDAFAFTLLKAPEGAVLEGEVLKWTPTHAQAGRRQQFTLRAMDEHGAVRLQHWSVIPRREPARGVLAGRRTRH
jgi:hypothetical protein